MPRRAGQHIWDMVSGFLNRDNKNIIKTFYFAMFDEYVRP
jgi:hypothetical protein